MISVMNTNDFDFDFDRKSCPVEIEPQSKPRVSALDSCGGGTYGGKSVNLAASEGDSRSDFVETSNGEKFRASVDPSDRDMSVVDCRVSGDIRDSNFDGERESRILGSSDNGFSDRNYGGKGLGNGIVVKNGKADLGLNNGKGCIEVGKSYDSMLDELAARGKVESVSIGPSKAVGCGYEIGDMLRGKVKSHPGCPSQIYNEEFASPSVRRSMREGHAFPEFPTQMALGSMTGANDTTPTTEDPTTVRKKNPKWTTEQNLVLLNRWIKYGTDSVIGKNQKSEAYWDKIADFCNEHCSFNPPRDKVACKNHFNYINKILCKWIGAYDHAKRIKKSGWSENDVLAKAHELYTSGKNGTFNLMLEWQVVRDQPRYVSQVGGNIGSDNNESKRSRENDVGDSNSVESIARPMGRESTKRKSRKKSKGVDLEVINEEWNEFKQFKEQELERLDKIALRQEEANQLMKENTLAKKMKMFMKLSDKEHLDDQSKKLLEMLSLDLFGK